MLHQKKSRPGRFAGGCLVLWIIGCIFGCGFREEVLLTGQTMGTTYHVKVVAGHGVDTEDLQKRMDAYLEQINQSMSIFSKDSEISRFNAMKETGQKMVVSKGFYDVMVLAGTLYERTDGAWDGTLGPLINLWGFGSSVHGRDVPTPEMIHGRLARVGFNQIEIHEDRSLSKRHSDVVLNLSSVAKGFAVDEIVRLIKSRGIEDCLVEIGGEVRASGRRADGSFWKVGINMPRKDAPADLVYRAMVLENAAVATSGGYRNYFEKHGKSYSHIIDPRTGYPVQCNVVSASVLADSCALADGLATSLMVMGPEKGLVLINSLPGVECCIVIESKDGRLEDFVSDGFELLQTAA